MQIPHDRMTGGVERPREDPVGTCRTVELTGTLSLEDAAAIAEMRARPVLSESAARRVAEGHARLQSAISAGHTIYGITTGFGPLADRLIAPSDAQVLQENLVFHLATGVGPSLPWHWARAVVLARLNSMLQGVSGASIETVDLLVSLLSSPFAPSMPEKGTVGASGDLTPLAHMTLCLMGRRSFLAEDGSEVPVDTVFQRLGRAPLALSARDGLALVNGTSAMTGIAVMNARLAERSIDWALALSAATAELLEGRSEAWDPAFERVRPHPGQAMAARRLRARIAGSGRVRNDTGTRAAAGSVPSGTRQHRPPQDPYTLRCVPQIVGAAIDSRIWHDRLVATELNSATDNPIFPEYSADDPVRALHGGNFMGQHVALASDALANAVVMTAGLVERQLARLTDEGLNGGLPAFLHRGTAGLNSGFMGAQVTATALLAEARSNAGAASIQSISTNAANQDVVSMGTVAARKTGAQLEMLFQIEAILALAVSQAFDILNCPRQHGFSAAFRNLHAWVREHVAEMPEDRPLSEDIELLAGLMAKFAPPVGALPGSDAKPSAGTS